MQPVNSSLLVRIGIVTELPDDLSTPLPGVPMALDLLNTEWLEDADGPVDVLAVRPGVEAWLVSHGYEPRLAGPARGPLLQTRAAIRAAVPEAAGYAALNAVLAHAQVSLWLDDAGTARQTVRVDDPGWAPAVAAARNLVELLEQAPDRIRCCRHPECELWFFDTTRNGSRRWCSMADCGNRAKAKRHYQRTRARRRI